jgi:hypothetical protein
MTQNVTARVRITRSPVRRLTRLVSQQSSYALTAGDVMDASLLKRPWC